MAFDRHTAFAGGLVAVIVAAIIGGMAITGGPGQARKERQDAIRLGLVERAALALVCYRNAEGDIPEDLSIVWAAFAEVGSETRKPSQCRSDAFSEAEGAKIAAEGFTLRRTAGAVTHICAEFAAPSQAGEHPRFGTGTAVVPNLNEARETAGEHCFELDLTIDLE